MVPFLMNKVLETEGLVVGHGGKALLGPLSFTLEMGTLSCLLGVNGSGKSTLLRTLAGLHAPVAGSVKVQGADMAGAPSTERARLVSVVLTGRPDMGMLDVRTLVALGRQPWTGRLGRLGSEDHARVDKALERVAATDLQGRQVGALSDGEMQKLLIARALAQDTPVMLLDEPTAFLDVVNRQRVMRLLKGIAADEGRAVLLTTHDLPSALHYGDRLLVIHGRGIQAGAPRDVLERGVLADAFGHEVLEASLRPGG
jgi:iron complex transport system ATP-binding protein